MASQTNHNSSYLYEVDGLTPWEKLRVIRGFLTQHKQNLALAELNIERTEYRLSKLTDCMEDQFERREIAIHSAESLDAMKKCKDEIRFLEKLEAELVNVTEPTRIEGKTDDEMYELNFYHEYVTRLARKAQCEFIASGQIGTETMEHLVRCKPALEILDGQGILQLEAINSVIQYERPEMLEYTNIDMKQLGLVN